MSDGSTSDKGVLNRVLVREQAVNGKEGSERRGGSGGNVIAIPLESLGVDLSLDLGDRPLLNLGRLWVETFASELNADDEQLSFDTDGGKAQVLVEGVQSAVGERATNNTGEGNIRDMGVAQLTKPR